MDKKITIAIIAIIVAVVAIGAYLGLANTFIPESSQMTDLFDYSIEPTTSWNAEKKEYSFSQSIRSVNGKDYKNIDIKVNFYKGNNLLGSYDSKIDSTKDGKFTLKFTFFHNHTTNLQVLYTKNYNYSIELHHFSWLNTSP